MCYNNHVRIYQKIRYNKQLFYLYGRNIFMVSLKFLFPLLLFVNIPALADCQLRFDDGYKLSKDIIAVDQGECGFTEGLAMIEKK